MIGDRDTNQVWKGLKYLMRMYVTMQTFYYTFFYMKSWYVE